MRKCILILLAAAMLLSLCGCGGFVSILPDEDNLQVAVPAATQNPDEPDVFGAQPLLAFLGMDALAESYYSNTPVALSYQPAVAADGTQGCRAYVFDRATIIAACDALRGMNVMGRAESEPVSGEEYVLTLADGTEYRFSFGALENGTRTVRSFTGVYELEGGDALWNTAFPAYDASFDVFDLYFNPDIRAFADGFEENRPVSVGYRMNSGATITNSDPWIVEQAFRALQSMTVIVVENLPDRHVDLNQVRDYIFTMEDGTSYTFSFAQRCLAVTANQAFGPVYYWLNGIDNLWNVQIASSENGSDFPGGPVAGLREDIQEAADIANGVRTDLSVSGIFIDYNINGESGYAAISGETAMSFLRMVCSIQAGSEPVEYVEGDRITISVTLSDLSGPIFYFTGDSIQQLVGRNYYCDSGQMANLRSTVQQLAADPDNTVIVEMDSTE